MTADIIEANPRQTEFSNSPQIVYSTSSGNKSQSSPAIKEGEDFYWLQGYPVDARESLNTLVYFDTVLVDGKINYRKLHQLSKNVYLTGNDESGGSTTWSIMIKSSLDVAESPLQQRYEKRASKLDIHSKMLADKAFQMLLSYTHNLPYIKQEVEITPLNSVKVSLLFEKEILLVVSKPFLKSDDIKDNQVVFSIIVESQLIATNISDANEFFQGFRRFLEM